MQANDDMRRVRHIRAGAGTTWWAAGDTCTFKAISEDTNRRFTIFELSVPARAGPPLHVHQVEDEAYYILEGELEMRDHKRVRKLRAGDFVHIPPGTPHTFKNPGSQRCRILVFISPAGLENFFFEVGQPARAGEQAPVPGAEELERMLAAAPKYGLTLHLPDAE